MSFMGLCQDMKKDGKATTVPAEEIMKAEVWEEEEEAEEDPITTLTHEGTLITIRDNYPELQVKEE